eukprot:6850021-Pyramimonas_sp.AAC.1
MIVSRTALNIADGIGSPCFVPLSSLNARLSRSDTTWPVCPACNRRNTCTRVSGTPCWRRECQIAEWPRVFNAFSKSTAATQSFKLHSLAFSRMSVRVTK